MTRVLSTRGGRGCRALTGTAFDLGLWMHGALATLLGFVASTKSAVERVTLRGVRRRKERYLTRRLAVVSR